MSQVLVTGDDATMEGEEEEVLGEVNLCGSEVIDGDISDFFAKSKSSFDLRLTGPRFVFPNDVAKDPPLLVVDIVLPAVLSLLYADFGCFESAEAADGQEWVDKVRPFF